MVTSLATNHALGGFTPSPIPENLEESSSDGGDGDDDDGWLGFEGFEGCGEMWGEDSFIDLLYVYLFLFFLLFCRV